MGFTFSESYFLCFQQPLQRKPGSQSQSDHSQPQNWSRVWQLALAVMGSMLRTLRHGFLKEALDFAGVHRERLAEVIVRTRV